MSSTGRSDARLPDDDYATPAWATDLVLDEPGVASLIADPDVAIVEPCAGKGAIVERLRARGVAKNRITAIELNEQRAAACRKLVPAVRCGDFFEVVKGTASTPVLFITNPPYRLALEFVERCINAGGPNGNVVMLLRLAFLETLGRAAFHRDHPSRVFVLSRRPSFAFGATDSTAYAWFHWHRSFERGRWSILGPFK